MARERLEMPAEVPFLASLSWSDADYRQLAPLEVLQRYEAGWRHRGALAEPSVAELAYLRALIEHFGSHLHV